MLDNYSREKTVLFWVSKLSTIWNCIGYNVCTYCEVSIAVVLMLYLHGTEW